MTEHTAEFMPIVGKFDQTHLAPRSIEEALYESYMWQLTKVVSNALIGESFDPAAIPAALHAAVDEHTPRVVGQALEAEAEWRSKESNSLTQVLGGLGLLGERADSLQPPQYFVDNLHEQIRALPYDFSELLRHREVYETTQCMQFIQAIRKLADSGRPGWQDEAFTALAEAVDHFDDYALPTDKLDALYMLVYMPGYPRQLSRRLIVNATYMRCLKDTLGPDLSEDEATMLEAIQGYYKSKSLGREMWDASLGTPLSESSQVRLAAIELDDMERLATIQRLFQAGRGARVTNAWEHIRDILDTTVNQANRRSALRSWQMTDVGHGFRSFRDHGMTIAMDATRPEKLSSPVKTGEHAIIFEDDPAQMRRYHQFVEENTRMINPEELCFTIPEHVLAAAADPNVKLFLLDMQNGDDNFAGVELARQIVELRVGIDTADRKGKNQKTQVVVWTASAELADAASKHLEPFLRQQPVDYSITGGGRTGGGKLAVSVRLKGWSPFDLRHVN
ncbi:hypothetical protein EYC59_06285 [Candidatus Saccharibacteria bacterium]|nr:MAG: hypothetical protein EYC59_06285 [Candidatus Saccharibacteria bacterium]